MFSSKVCLVAALLGASASAQTLNSTSAYACSGLSSVNSSALLYPGSDTYEEQITDYWDLRADLTPACVFLPATADQVAGAVSVITGCSAQFALRGGGHMNFPGSNNIDGGVLLALNQLTELTVSKADLTYASGPGNRWVDVYEALEPYGLYAIGGRMKTIGVPGLTLIGGFHYFINKYGYVMDNVLSYDVVLGNGTRVVANATSNPDLFWALKGGANNFGIVTKFVSNAYAIPELSTTIQSFDEVEAESFIAATCNLAANDDASIAAGAIISITYNTTTGVASPSLLGVQEGTESPPSRFANFSAITPVSRVDNVTTPVQWHSQLDSPFQMMREQFAHKTMKPNATRLYEIYEAWKAAIADIEDVEGVYPTLVLNTVPKSAAAVGKTNGIGNVWGLPDSQSYVIWQLSTGWSNAEDDLRMTSWAKNFVDYHHSINQQLGLSTEWIYMGDAGEFQNPFLGFPMENVARMREVRAAYDPNGVFTTLNWGGFKLGA